MLDSYLQIYRSLHFLSFSTIFIERIEMVSYNERVLVNDFYQVKFLNS